MAQRILYPCVYRGKVEQLYLVRQTYLHPRTLCVQAYDKDGLPFATLTVNLCSKSQSFNSAFVDTNNCPWVEQFLVLNGIASRVKNISARSGFCIYPLYEFDLSKLCKTEPEEDVQNA